MTLYISLLGSPDESTFNVINGKNLPSKVEIFKPMNLAEVFHWLDVDELDLISKLLIINPEKRISFREALKHVLY